MNREEGKETGQEENHCKGEGIREFPRCLLSLKVVGFLQVEAIATPTPVPKAFLQAEPAFPCGADNYHNNSTYNNNTSGF